MKQHSNTRKKQLQQHEQKSVTKRRSKKEKFFLFWNILIFLEYQSFIWYPKNTYLALFFRDRYNFTLLVHNEWSFQIHWWNSKPLPFSGDFLTQESNQGLLHFRWILYQLSYQGSPIYFLTRSIKLIFYFKTVVGNMKESNEMRVKIIQLFTSQDQSQYFVWLYINAGVIDIYLSYPGTAIYALLNSTY